MTLRMSRSSKHLDETLRAETAEEYQRWTALLSSGSDYMDNRSTSIHSPHRVTNSNISSRDSSQSPREPGLARTISASPAEAGADDEETVGSRRSQVKIELQFPLIIAAHLNDIFVCSNDPGIDRYRRN